MKRKEKKMLVGVKHSSSKVTRILDEQPTFKLLLHSEMNYSNVKLRSFAIQEFAF
jgi:hypothetical protein